MHPQALTPPAPLRPPRTPRHIFSVDVEEYFQVSAFERVVDRRSWDSYPSRVEASVDVLLGLLAAFDATATFFCLGWIADRHGAMIRRIADAGHEIASHGWWHRRVTEMSPKEFAEDVRSSKALLEDVSGTHVIGYRAPSFSITPGHEWALDVLLEQGYQYDSSLFPIRRPGYGYPGGLTLPHTWTRAAGTLIELPPATWTSLGVRLPAAGGGYLRQFPLSLIRAAIRQQEQSAAPAMLYIHPWELDTEQPHLPVGLLTRVRHYRGLGRTRDRLERLLAEFEFTSVSRYLSVRSRVGSPTGEFAIALQAFRAELAR